jgi:hypothetical protein
LDAHSSEGRQGCGSGKLEINLLYKIKHGMGLNQGASRFEFLMPLNLYKYIKVLLNIKVY